MKIALIYPPFYHKLFNENLPTVDDEFGVFPYISYGWVAAAARGAGADVRLFDAAATRVTYEEVLKEVQDYNPDLLAFAAHAPQTFHDMLIWANRFKKDTGLPILAGGAMTQHYAPEIMYHRCIDYLCTGEIFGFLEPFLNCFGKKGDFNGVPSLAFRSGGEGKDVIFTSKGPTLPFKDFPILDRSIFRNELYYSHVSQRQNFTIGMSSRGCPHHCTFCCMARTGLDPRDALSVVDEMQECSTRYGIREIDWFDPVMLEKRQRSVQIADELIRRKLDMIWSARARIDSLLLDRTGKPDEGFIQKLADSGCRRLFLGIESGDEEVLQAISKQLKPEQVGRVLKALRNHGIRSLGFFMVGNPGETQATVAKTIRLARSLPLDYAQFSMTVAKSSTQLDENFLKPFFGFDYWRKYIQGEVAEQVLPTPWTTLKRFEIEALAKKAYFQFYVRPRYIVRTLMRVESWEEFLRYVRVGMQLIFRPVLTSPRPSRMTRIMRAVLVLFESILATLNRKGNRHPVKSGESELKMALRLAREELK